MLAQFDSAILEAVRRASKCSSRVVHEDMKAGLYDLATVASIAPWVGIFGTIAGIVSCFTGIDGEKTALMAALCRCLAWSVSFTALGLLVGLAALWFYEYLAARLRSLDLEMENSSMELLNQLRRFPGRFEVGPVTGRYGDGPMFGEQSLDEVQREEKFFRRCIFLAGTTLVLTWLVQVSRYFLSDSLSLYSSLRAASFDIPMVFGISCFFLYPIWSRLLHRRPGALVAMGSTLGLCWSVAELVLGRHLP